MRAVLDTNVIVSAALMAGGNPDRILQALKRREFDLVTSEPLLDELERIISRRRIARRLTWSGDERANFPRDIRRRAIVVAPTSQVDRITVDAIDNRVLEAAVEGQADFIVSGDRHLLDLERHENIVIVTPRRFVAILTEASP